MFSQKYTCQPTMKWKSIFTWKSSLSWRRLTKWEDGWNQNFFRSWSLLFDFTWTMQFLPSTASFSGAVYPYFANLLCKTTDFPFILLKQKKLNFCKVLQREVIVLKTAHFGEWVLKKIWSVVAWGIDTDADIYIYKEVKGKEHKFLLFTFFVDFSRLNSQARQACWV